MFKLKLLISVALLCTTFSSFGQKGVLFQNREPEGYTSEYKINDGTYLWWDLNGGSKSSLSAGAFEKGDKSVFMYWDNEAQYMAHLIDDRNMINLNAMFHSLVIPEALSVQNGKIGIGTTDPDERLTVNGKIHTKGVTVDLSIPVPDYVFEADYPLRKLEEVEAYITTHKHLPGVPAGKVLEAEGMDLEAMNLMLLKKIEELTIYQIQLHKRINELENGR